MMKIIGKSLDGFIIQSDRRDAFLLTGKAEGDVSLDVGSEIPVGRIVTEAEAEGKEIDKALVAIRLLKEMA